MSKRPKEILDYLLTFRFLNTRHIQKLLNQNNPTYIQTLLGKLLKSHYVKRHYSRKTYDASSTPAIYYLAARSRHILKNNDSWNAKVLERIYKEGTRSEKFIDHCLMLADIYLFFRSQKESKEELHFFTKTALGAYDYFPEELPDAYIALKSKRKTKRYFLDLFDPSLPPRFIRRRLRAYLAYEQDGSWQDATGDSYLPSILFVLPSENMKKHINYYAKAKLENELDDTISLFLTTTISIKNAKNNSNIWQEVV